MYQWLWSKYYDRLMRDCEAKGLREWRESLLKGVSGHVLEIGSGTGANLEFYSTDKVKCLILAEPNAYMRQRSMDKAFSSGFEYLSFLSDKAEKLSLPNASVDYVVCTLVLCSVDDLEQSLSEIHRVLRAQGKLIFIEHVAASNNPKRYQWQSRLAFLWKHLMDGCHVQRLTEEAISKAGFKIMDINRQSMRGVPPIVRPSIRGVAVK